MSEPLRVRHLAVVESAAELRGRINLALSVLQQRYFCGDDAWKAQLVVMALQGASIDQLRERDR